MNLGKELVERGHEVTWIGMRMPNTKKVEVNKDGVIIRRINVPFREQYMQSRKLFCFMPQLFKVIEDADVVQWNSFVAGITGGVISKLKDKPHVLLTHEMFTDLWKKFTKNKIEQVVFPFMEKMIIKNKYDAGICPCDYTKRTMVKLGMPEYKIKIIPHGIDHKHFHPKYAIFKEQFELWDRYVVGWCGRMGFKGSCYSKNLKCLFQAFKKVKEKVPNSVLLMAGTGFDDVSWYIKELGLEIGKDVVYVGKLKYEEIPEFYSSLDVFASSSLSEGFGFTLVEAQACGTPVVAFDKAGSVPEVVSKNKSGKLVIPQTPSALAKGIIEFHKFPRMRGRMAVHGMRWVKQYNWKKSAKEHEEVYEDIYCHHKIKG